MSDSLDVTPHRSGQEEIEVVEEIEQAASRVRAEARAELGITGDENVPPLRKVLREEHVSVYPLVALSTLALVNVFWLYAFGVLSPDISRGLGIGLPTILAINSLDTIAIVLSPLPMAWLTQRKARRASLCILTAIGWSLITIYTGLITGLGALLFVVLFDGISTGSVQALHFPLLMDSYPPRVRVRALSAYSALGDVGLAYVLSPLLVAVLAATFSLTWRGIFLVMGIMSLLGTSVAFRLRDPGFGRFDTRRIRRTVQEARGDVGDDSAAGGRFPRSAGSGWPVCSSDWSRYR